MAKKISRKKLLKEPDEFITTTGRIIRFAMTHKKACIYSFIAFCIAISGISGTMYMVEKRETKAFELLAAAMNSKKSDTQGLSETAKKNFDMLLEKYPSKTAGKIGRLIYAGSLVAVGSFREAEPHFKECLKEFDEPLLFSAAENGLAYLFEATGRKKEAADTFKSLGEGDSPYAPSALFNAARLFEETGDYEKSVGYYERLLKEYSDSFYAPLAAEMVSLQKVRADS